MKAGAFGDICEEYFKTGLFLQVRILYYVKWARCAARFFVCIVLQKSASSFWITHLSGKVVHFRQTSIQSIKSIMLL